VLIKARLKGHEFDLITLAELFREGDPAVAADDEGYYLSFSAPDPLFREAGPLYEAAAVVLRRVNGVGYMLTDEFRPVNLTGRFSDETGQQQQVVLAEAAEARDRAFAAAVAIDGHELPAPPARGPDYVQLADAQPDVAEVLDILGKANPAPDWSDLYKVFEIVRDNVGGQRALEQQGWVSRNEIDVFKASANRKEVSGDQARHARWRGSSPRRTMTLVEGRQMIGVMVTAWMESLR
jgi:hypothetical protein